MAVNIEVILDIVVTSEVEDEDGREGAGEMKAEIEDASPRGNANLSEIGETTEDRHHRFEMIGLVREIGEENVKAPSGAVDLLLNLDHDHQITIPEIPGTYRQV